MFQAGFLWLLWTATESQPKAKHIIDVDGGEEGDLKDVLRPHTLGPEKGF